MWGKEGKKSLNWSLYISFLITIEKINSIHDIVESRIFFWIPSFLLALFASLKWKCKMDESWFFWCPKCYCVARVLLPHRPIVVDQDTACPHLHFEEALRESFNAPSMKREESGELYTWGTATANRFALRPAIPSPPSIDWIDFHLSRIIFGPCHLLHSKWVIITKSALESELQVNLK